MQKVSENQKIQSVLIIGEGRSCKTILGDTARLLREYGFRNVGQTKEEKLFSFDERYLESYKRLFKNAKSVFAWRLLIEELDHATKKMLSLIVMMIGGNLLLQFRVTSRQPIYK